MGAGRAPVCGKSTERGRRLPTRQARTLALLNWTVPSRRLPSVFRWPGNLRISPGILACDRYRSSALLPDDHPHRVPALRDGDRRGRPHPAASDACARHEPERAAL